MAIIRYVLTADVTVAAGTAATVVAGEPGTGGAAGYGNAATTSDPPVPADDLAAARPPWPTGVTN